MSIRCLSREAGILVPEITGVPPRISGLLSMISVLFFILIIIYYTKLLSNEVTAGEEGNTEDGKNDAENVIGIANVGVVAIKEFGKRNENGK